MFAISFLPNHDSESVVTDPISLLYPDRLQVDDLHGFTVDLHMSDLVFLWLLHFDLKRTTALEHLLTAPHHSLQSQPQLIFETHVLHHPVIYLLLLECFTCYFFIDIDIGNRPCPPHFPQPSHVTRTI